MLKGINKQIIEIKCTENECFDKIILFVNANKNHLHPDILRKNAVDIASAITGDKMFSTNRKFNSAAVISTIMGVAMLVLLLIALCKKPVYYWHYVFFVV